MNEPDLRGRTLPAGGFWWAHNLIVDIYAPVVGHLALAVYAVICRHANTQGQAWPSIRRFTKTLRTGRTQIRTAITKLETAGLVRVTPRLGDDGCPRSNLYQLLEPQPLAAQGDGLAADPSGSEPPPGESAGLEEDLKKQRRRLPSVSITTTRETHTRASSLPIALASKDHCLVRTVFTSMSRARAREAAAQQAFDRLWAKLPRKVAKQAAWKAWLTLWQSELWRKGKLVTDQLQRIVTALERDIPKWREKIDCGEGEFVPHFATWINGRRWEDEGDPDPTPPVTGYPAVKDLY